jgi:hypothetical protein
MREGTTSRVMVADRPYGAFYDFYSVSPEYFGYTFVLEATKNLRQVTILFHIQWRWNCIHRFIAMGCISVNPIRFWLFQIKTILRMPE